MNLTTPDVYLQDLASGSTNIGLENSSVGILIGTARSGLVGVPQLVGSWSEYIEKYAYGLDTPFMKDSDLSYAVYGFFNNGGRQLYVLRVADSTTAKKATATVLGGLVVTALYEGVAGNDISIAFKKEDDETYSATIKLGTETVTVTDLDASNILAKLNGSRMSYIAKFEKGEAEIVLADLETTKLTGGADDISKVSTATLKTALEQCDSVVAEASFIAIPGYTDTALNTAILEYGDKNMVIPFLDMPVGSEVADVKSYRRTVSAYGGALAYPWGHVNDPLTNELRLVPTCGHLMGVYARTIAERGIHKAPAGTEAVVRGFVSLEKNLTNSEIGVLNSAGVICITTRSNVGVVVWGARSLNPDSTMKYTTDVLLNYFIKKALYVDTQFAIFEPNSDILWAKVIAACKTRLEELRLQGSLQGTQSEAYYVKCDNSNNTKTSINEGILNVEVGYAPVKPAEYVIIKIAHSMDNLSE